MDQNTAQMSSDRLADAVHDANAAVVRFVETCPPERWQCTTAEEGWTLSMAGAHIALAHLIIARWAHLVGSGLDITETLDDFAKSNASDSRFNSNLSQSAVIERLRVYGAALERIVRDMSEEQLNTSAYFHGSPVTATEVIENIAVGHARGHLAHMVAASEAPEA